jgi:hypothetical protein
MKHLIFLLVIILFTGCNEDETPTPIAEPVALLKSKTWGPNDFNEFEYNPAGLLTRYYSQWTNMIGTNNTSSYQLDFEYQDSKVVKATIRANGTFAGTLFYNYQHGLIHEVEHKNHLNKLERRIKLLYQNNRLQEVQTDHFDLNGEVFGKSKTRFTYLSSGNLQKQEEFTWNESIQNYEINYKMEYTSYDQEIHGEPYLFNDIHLPGLKFFRNNPLEVELYSGENLERTFMHQYEYNEDGFPIIHRQKFKEFPAVAEVVSNWEYY